MKRSKNKRKLNSNILRKLKKKAEDHESAFRVRIVAAVIHKGKIVAVGRNQRKTHPVAAYYGKHEEAIYLHAEVDAINKAKKKVKDLSEAELYVVRIMNDGSYGMCKPCDGCSKCIDDHNIKSVTYTNRNGEIEHVSCNREARLPHVQ